MAVTTPEQVTPEVDRESPVYWTTFPAGSVQADWSDLAAAHRAVMRLFPTTLPGAPVERRATAGILFRVDNIGGVPTVLVQSSVPPESVPIEGRTMTVTGRGWENRNGDLIALRVAVNPIIRGKSQALPGVPKKDVTRGVVPAEGISAWLSAKLAGAVTDLEVVNHYRDTYRFGPKGAKRSLVIDTVDAIATVSDARLLDAVRREGLGRSKAYGCGLITARPAMRD
ncbi:type I-E CRISPR-associated protein Cas6/Cse3/CasE [Nocardioides houyundeii]|uniref:type I-E CRISPR-associated protein Cas6/Cse3/CasE n=1 Tax=Nocardioides houyundeii TaxID=2045452 RepID=UPI000C77C3C4|nr:type I-E CRISPR-associated protein Cas6/Cse3/CasE [Nocardioides houyundeii]